MRRLAAVLLLLVAAGCSGDEQAAPPASMTSTEATTAAPQDTSAPASSTSSAGPPRRRPAAGCDVPAGYPEPWADGLHRPSHRRAGKAARDRACRLLFVPDADTDRLVFRLWANAPRIGRAGGPGAPGL